jgi:hypothetical protein
MQISLAYPHDDLRVPRCLTASGTASRPLNKAASEAVFIFVHSAAPKGLGKAFYFAK